MVNVTLFVQIFSPDLSLEIIIWNDKNPTKKICICPESLSKRVIQTNQLLRFIANDRFNILSLPIFTMYEPMAKTL